MFKFYLQAVGKNDIWVHGTHIQMVDEGAFNPVWNLLQGSQLLFYFVTHLIKYQRCFIKMFKSQIKKNKKANLPH